MNDLKNDLAEENMPFTSTPRGIIDIHDDPVRDGLNSQLASVTSQKFVTPYIALERVSKVLANYHIFIAKHSFLEGESGMLAWPVEQFGAKIGQTDDGDFVEGPKNEFNIYFEYRRTDCGMFNVFCEVVDEDELEEILGDLEAELNGDTEEEEEEGDEELYEENLQELSTEKYAAARAEAKKRERSIHPDAPNAKKWKGYYKMIQDRATRRIADKIKKSDELSEQTTDNDAPLSNMNTIDGAVSPRPSSLQKPKSKPLDGTDDMNKDKDGNTVVESNKSNKEKKKQALQRIFGGKLKDVRKKIKGEVNRDFDPRQLKAAE